MTSAVNANKRILLENLPRLLKGYGKSWKNYPSVVFVICDLDDKCLKTFREKLFGLLETCTPQPETRFCIAIEEGEAWFLGDIPAIKAAYPNAKKAVLNSYVNDSICGTWETLANAIYKDGATKLKKEGWQAVGAKKSEWAKKITPHMDVYNNKSDSFVYFRTKLEEFK
jgi:hypothetical protein